MSDRGNERINRILGLLSKVRSTQRGWVACCPAHPDRSPSLSLRVGEGVILVKCFAGCRVEDICAAVGLNVRDLFLDPTAPRGRKCKSMQLPRRPQWRTTATALAQHAMALQVRADSVLEAAKSLDASTWSETDLNHAIEAVSQAYRDTERAILLEEVAFSLRAKGLAKEQSHP